MTRTRKLLLGAAVALLAIQLVPLPRTNPPATAPLAAPPELQAVLDRACMDCHSHATKWPWTAYVAPFSWLVVYDTHEGREHLNLSTWGEKSARKQAKAAHEMWEEVEEGEMPLPPYLWMHPEARLSDADRALLKRWSESFAASDGESS